MSWHPVDTFTQMSDVVHTLAEGGFRATSAGIKGIARYFPVAYEKIPTFQLNGRPVEHFIHRKNTGYPPYRMSERTIELALADTFLTKMRDTRIVEIGAVTPIPTLPMPVMVILAVGTASPVPEDQLVAVEKVIEDDPVPVA